MISTLEFLKNRKSILAELDTLRADKVTSENKIKEFETQLEVAKSRLTAEQGAELTKENTDLKEQVSALAKQQDEFDARVSAKALEITGAAGSSPVKLTPETNKIDDERIFRNGGVVITDLK